MHRRCRSSSSLDVLTDPSFVLDCEIERSSLTRWSRVPYLWYRDVLGGAERPVSTPLFQRRGKRLTGCRDTLNLRCLEVGLLYYQQARIRHHSSLEPFFQWLSRPSLVATPAPPATQPQTNSPKTLQPHTPSRSNHNTSPNPASPHSAQASSRVKPVKDFRELARRRQVKRSAGARHLKEAASSFAPSQPSPPPLQNSHLMHQPKKPRRAPTTFTPPAPPVQSCAPMPKRPSTPAQQPYA